jgi:hypothetical protein
MVKEFVYLPTGRGGVRLRWVGGRNHYFRKLPEYCDDQMRQVMEATDVDGLALKKVID